MDRRGFLRATGATLAASAAAGCQGFRPEPGLDWSYDYDAVEKDDVGVVRLVGTVTNSGEVALPAAELVAHLLDDQGEILSQRVAEFEHLARGEEAPFDLDFRLPLDRFRRVDGAVLSPRFPG